MKKLLLITILAAIAVFSCKEKSANEQPSEQVVTLDPEINLTELEGDFKKWWTYHSYNISLAKDFKGIDELSDTIAKKEFLNKLATGKYIPLRLKSNDESEVYKLHKLDDLGAKNLGLTIKNESLQALNFFEMEGQDFPTFDLTDLKGNHYTNENTKGKTLILKTWFIACQACIEEFPELNELVKKYEDRDDMAFVSLALDTKSELEEFLSKKAFDYSVVPSQVEFISKILKLDAYPTHIIVDKNGTILKVVNKASEMISFLTSENMKAAENKLPPPPPPTTM